jgi:hypothetical protein
VQKSFNKIRIAILLLLASTPLCIQRTGAQAIRPQAARIQPTGATTYHPGDTLRYEIRLAGPAASQLRSIKATLTLQGAKAPGQEGMLSSFEGSSMDPAANEGTFTVVIRVPAYAATGDYDITFVATSVDQTASFSYSTATHDFPVSPVHIQSSAQLARPSITVTPRP